MEIIRAEGQTPPAAWETLVVTGKARAAIRRATRETIRKQYAGLGRQIVERAFIRAGKILSEAKLKSALPRLARLGVDDVYAAVGRQEMLSSDVVSAVYPDYKHDQAQVISAGNDPGWFELQKADNLKFKVPENSSINPLPIHGINNDLPVYFAPNGGAVPGDRIVGILTVGEGITIYPIQSPALMAFDDEPERWLDVRWDIDEANKQRFPAQIRISAINEPGAFAEIAKVFGDADANIDGINIVKTSVDFRDLVLDVEVWNLKQLNSIVTELKTKPMISNVERVNG